MDLAVLRRWRKCPCGWWLILDIPDRSHVVDTPDIHWVATWGDQVKEGDLLRVKQLGGPVKVRNLRKFYTLKNDRPGTTAEDEGRWFLAAIVSDREGQEFHLYVQPHEAVFVGVEVGNPQEDQ